ncbi:MAG: YdeI/OmpD-associated family protein [Gemmatimonadales bacterium]
MLDSIDSAPTFRAWLRKHHRTETALVLRIAKRHAAATGITYAEALDEALCFGWIDGVRRRLDADSFSIRFTPRKPRSIWSRVNVAHAERLIREKRMTRAGLAAFEARTAGRTGIYAFEQPVTELPAAYRVQFRKQRSAWKYFQQEAPWYRRTSTHWVTSAKREETRLRRLGILIACSGDGVRIPQLRRA